MLKKRGMIGRIGSVAVASAALAGLYSSVAPAAITIDLKAISANGTGDTVTDKAVTIHQGDTITLGLYVSGLTSANTGGGIGGFLTSIRSFSETYNNGTSWVSPTQLSTVLNATDATLPTALAAFGTTSQGSAVLKDITSVSNNPDPSDTDLDVFKLQAIQNATPYTTGIGLSDNFLLGTVKFTANVDATKALNWGVHLNALWNSANNNGSTMIQGIGSANGPFTSNLITAASQIGSDVVVTVATSGAPKFTPSTGTLSLNPGSSAGVLLNAAAVSGTYTAQNTGTLAGAVTSVTSDTPSAFTAAGTGSSISIGSNDTITVTSAAGATGSYGTKTATLTVNPQDSGTKAVTLNVGVGHANGGLSFASANVLFGNTVTGNDASNLASKSDNLQTEATILAGTAAGNVTMNWRTAQTGEAVFSDIVQVTNMKVDGGSVYVLQMSYNPPAGVEPSSIKLGALLGGQWLGATFGNIPVKDVSPPNNYQESWAQFTGVGGEGYGQSLSSLLGDYGVDTTNHKVWAVLNYNGEFAVIPQPAAIWGGLLGFASVGLMAARRRFRR